MSVREDWLEKERQEARVVLGGALIRGGVPIGVAVGQIYVWGIVGSFFGLLATVYLWAKAQELIEALGIANDLSLSADLTKMAIYLGPLLVFVVAPAVWLYRRREKAMQEKFAEVVAKLPARAFPAVGSLCQLHPEGGPVFQITRLVRIGVVDLVGVVDGDGLPDDSAVTRRIETLFKVGLG